MFGGVDPFFIIAGAAVLVGGLSIIPALIAAPLAIIPELVGLGLALTGVVWVLVIAFQESVGTGLLALCCGIYWLIFAITNFSETKIPLTIWFVGVVIRIIAVGIVAGAHH